MEIYLLALTVGCLLVAILEYRKERREHKKMAYRLNVMEKSDKVIKDCVVYGKLPLIVSGEYLAFLDCTFENLDRTWQDARLLEILGN